MIKNLKLITLKFLLLFIPLQINSISSHNNASIEFSAFIDNEQQMTETLRDEYKKLKTEFKNPKIRKKKNLSDRISWLNGYIPVYPNNYPLLYQTVNDLCEKIDLKIPIITVFRGNGYQNFFSYLTGADFRINAFATTDFRNTMICIGEDLINNLNYEEIRSIVAHELGHLKKNHLAKKLVIGTSFAYLGEYLFTVFHPIIKTVTFAGVSLGAPFAGAVTGTLLANTLAMPAMALSRKHEKEADLVALHATNNHEHLVNGLNKLESTYQKKHPFWYRVGKALHKILPFPHTHPTNKQREEYLKKEAKKIKKK